MSFPGGHLDVGSITRMCSGAELSISPILQIVRQKEVTLENEGITIRRFRYGLSDSKNVVSALSTTRYSGGTPYPLYSVIQLMSFSFKPTYRHKANTICARDGVSSFVFIILNSTLINDSLTKIIGNPVEISYSSKVENQQQQQQQQQQKLEEKGVGEIEKTMDGSPIIPIRDVDPYQQKWAIRARVQNKGEIRKWSNERGQGQLFSMGLLDSSGEIRATCFNEAVDKFHPMLEQNGVYLISKCQVKFSNKKFTSIKHPYELHLDVRTVVSKVENSNRIPEFHFEFVEIDQIQDVSNNELVDVCGVVMLNEPSKTTHTKRGDTLLKTIEIADDTNRSIEVKIWGEKAQEFEDIMNKFGPNPLLFMKNVRVSEFSGKSLTFLSNSEILVNLNIARAHKICKWFNGLNGNFQNVISLTTKFGSSTTIKSGIVYSKDEKTLSSITTEQLGLTSSKDYLVVPDVTLVWKLRENSVPWYIACSNPDCKGSKANETNGIYVCTKCGSQTGTEPRWILNCVGYDFTGKEFMSAIGNVGDILMGVSVKKAFDIYNSNDLFGLYTIFEEAKYKTFRLRLSVHMDDSYNQAGRRKCTIISASPCDYVENAKIMLKKLDQM